MGRAVLAAQSIEERNALVEEAMEAIRNTAYMVLRRFCANIEVEDLIQQGCLGAMQAAGKYDPSRGIPFPAFAYQRIRGAMYDSLRRNKFTAVAMLPIDLECPDDEIECADPEADERDLVLRIDDRRTLSKVAKAMQSLTPRQRQVVTIHYMQQRTLREAGEEIGVSAPRAAQIRSDAISQIRAILDAA